MAGQLLLWKAHRKWKCIADCVFVFRKFYFGFMEDSAYIDGLIMG